MKHQNKLVPIPLRPPIIALVLLIISAILNFTFPIKKIFFFPYNLTGILFVILGIQLILWGGNTFNKLSVELIPGSNSKQVVTSGPFTFSRNPIYLSFVIFLIGTSFLLGSAIAFIAPLTFIIIFNFFFIPFEERWMEKQFGKKYLDYKRNVRRWI